MIYDFNTTVEIDLTDVIDDMEQDERRELFEILRRKIASSVDEEKRELLREAPRCDKRELAAEILRDLPPFEFKRVLVNALGVPSYYSDDLLRDSLEPIITAR